MPGEAAHAERRRVMLGEVIAVECRRGRRLRPVAGGSHKAGRAARPHRPDGRIRRISCRPPACAAQDHNRIRRNVGDRSYFAPARKTSPSSDEFDHGTCLLWVVRDHIRAHAGQHLLHFEPGRRDVVHERRRTGCWRRCRRARPARARSQTQSAFRRPALRRRRAPRAPRVRRRR